MIDRRNSAAYMFAVELLDDLKSGTIPKDCLSDHFGDFTGGLEGLHRERHRSYLDSCGCFLMDRRLCALEEGYHG